MMDDLSCSEVDADSVAQTSIAGESTSTAGQLHAKKKENRVVCAARLLVLGMLVIAMVVLGVAVYLFMVHKEEQEFSTQYDYLANEVIEISQENVKRVFADLNTLSKTVTAFARHEKNTWPFVTLSDFEERGKAFRSSSQALIVAFLPVVKEDNRGEWRDYSFANQEWLKESYVEGTEPQMIPEDIWSYPGDRRLLKSCAEERRRMEEKVPSVELEGAGPYAPVWQISPPPPANNTQTINYNLFDKPVFTKAVSFIEHTRAPVFLDVCNQAAWFGEGMGNAEILQTVVVQPVFATFDEESAIVGHLVAVIPWTTFFKDILHTDGREISVVMSNTCNEVFTFGITGHTAIVISDEEDLHDKRFDDMERNSIFAEFANPSKVPEESMDDHCVYTIHTYPTEAMESGYISNEPVLYTAVVVSIFLFTSLVFLFYDFLVRRMRAAAEKHEGLVSSLFPEAVRHKVLKQQRKGNQQTNNDFIGSADLGDAPIADLYLNCTVMFADIAGFTAWSSARQPCEVFTLLETVYSAFDEIAHQRRVFKVETVGDCYVAVAGLPKPRRDHAVSMARFSFDCVNRFGVLVKSLESALGPDTSDLGLRVGLHSGNVTAGVIRGERARFQLFGDTVNTTSRIESTGQRNKIHISEETANLLIRAGKQHWVDPRQDTVEAKGKGILKTFWLNMKPLNDSSSTSSGSDSPMSESIEVEAIPKSPRKRKSSIVDQSLVMMASKDTKKDRLVDWNTNTLTKLLKLVVGSRSGNKEEHEQQRGVAERFEKEKRNPFDEVQEIIVLPSGKSKETRQPPDSIDLGPAVEQQLVDYVRAIAQLYRKNDFHNFEHASHVAMSASKLMSRIVATGDDDPGSVQEDHSYGITADPLTQFAVAFSALIHDCDHPGVPNAQLIKEGTSLAAAYENKSIAEQNSVDLAWSLLMDNAFADLRAAIFATQAEKTRFRQLVVNVVMATDIVDKELKKLRNARWEKAFDDSIIEHPIDARNRKATIVIEHLIQASDVAHTMQHWHIYRKWNERFFMECYEAYLAGRAEVNPAENWYKGEIGFFDFYVIPLAKKLKECGVFGVSSDEYLNYATQNRLEWEKRGQEVVAELVEKAMQRSETHAAFNSFQHSESWA